MAQDNTLGAPTEGLGQTVTFGVGQAPGTPQAQGTQRQRLQLGAQGGATMTSQALHVPAAKQNATFEALVRLGGEVLKPQMEAAAKEARMRGYRRAQEGEALQEIVDEQPWYSKLFGDTPMVEGARAYTAAAKAANLAADIETQLPELRKLDGPQFDQHLAKVVRATETGDAATDVLVQQQVERMLPTAINGWKKANVRYKQEQFEQSQTEAVVSAARQIGDVDRNARAGDGTRTDADTLGAATALLDTFVNPGIDPKKHDQLVGSGIIRDLNSGNFAAYNVLKSSKKFDELDPEVAFQVSRAYRQASLQAKINMPMDFLLKEAEFKQMARDPSVTDESVIVAKAQEINALAAQITGDAAPYLGPVTTVTELVQFRDEQRRQLDAAEREIAKTNAHAAKAQLKQDYTAQVAGAMVTGGVTVAHLPAETRQDAFDYIRATSPSKLNYVAVDQWKYGVRDKVLEGSIAGGLATAMQSTDAALFHEVYQTKLLPMIKDGGDLGLQVASSYAGPHSEVFERYHAAVRGQAMSPQDVQAAYRQAIAPEPKVTDAKFTKAIESQLTTGFVASLWTDAPIKDPAGLSRVLSPYVSRHLPLKDAVAKAKQDAPNLGIVGGYHWSKGARDTKLQTWVLENRAVGEADHSNVDKVFDHVVGEYAAERHMVGTPKVQQIQDAPGGIPQFVVMGETAAGDMRTATFTARDMNAKWLAKSKSTKQRTSSLPPTITAPGEFWE